MAWQFHPVLVFFALGGLLSLVVAGYCWRYMQKFGRSHLVTSIGLLSFYNAVWVFAAMLKTASTDLSLSLFFYKVEFFGVLPNTVVVLVIALIYVGKDRWLSRRSVTLLSLVPAAFIILTLVNPGNVMIVDPTLIPTQGILAFEHEFPPLFVVYLAWVYGSVLVAIWILAWGVIADRVSTTPALVAIVALLVPWVTTVLKTAGIYPPGGTGINVTPAASTIGISVLGFAIIRYQVFELIPVGRDQTIEVMPDGYLFVGPNEKILDTNPAAAKLLVGDNSTKLTNRTVDDLLPVYEDLTETSPIDVEIEGQTVEIRRSEVTRQNQRAGEMLLFRDVTEHRHREHELERQNERLDQFARVVSHDLRNPLNVAQGRLDLAQEDCDSDHLEDIDAAHDRMQDLIENLLTLARQRERVGELEPVQLDDLVDSCWSNVATKDATLLTEIEQPIRADESRLQQLIENLIRNAVEHGGADVTVHLGELAGGFFVEDDGTGIPEDARDDVFNAGHSTAQAGTGFGLSIVKEVAEAHGWDICLTEGTDGGARFEITGVEFIAT